MTRAQFLLGKILFNALLSLMQAILTIGAGAWVLGIAVRWDLAPLALAGVAIGNCRMGSSSSRRSPSGSGGTTCSTRSSTSRTSS